KRVMLRRIGVNSLIDSSVHCQVRLLIPIYIELRNSNSTHNGLLENGSANNLPFPCDFPRNSDVDRQELHLPATASIANTKGEVTKIGSGGCQSCTNNRRNEYRRDGRLVAYASQLFARAVECLTCQRNRFTRIIGQPRSEAVNRGVITRD